MCAPTDASFFISNFLGKCLDTDAASRNANAFASLSKCRQSSSQRIRVKEVSGGTREVTLQAAGKCLAPALNVIVQHMPVTLRACDKNSKLQKFVLDGDSISSAADRDFVVLVQNVPIAQMSESLLGKAASSARHPSAAMG